MKFNPRTHFFKKSARRPVEDHCPQAGARYF
jgi:hypothetical protein